MNTEIIEKQKEYIEKVKKINDNKNKKYYILIFSITFSLYHIAKNCY